MIHSQLFRRETSRRLREVFEPVIDSYLRKRVPWVGASQRPQRAAVRLALEALAEAVDRNDVTWYREFAAAECRDMIAEGVHPVALLAAGELLHGAVLEFMTLDQRELLREIFDAERRQRQEVVYEQVMGGLEQRGA